MPRSWLHGFLLNHALPGRGQAPLAFEFIRPSRLLDSWFPGQSGLEESGTKGLSYESRNRCRRLRKAHVFLDSESSVSDSDLLLPLLVRTAGLLPLRVGIVHLERVQKFHRCEIIREHLRVFHPVHGKQPLLTANILHVETTFENRRAD